MITSVQDFDNNGPHCNKKKIKQKKKEGRKFQAVALSLYYYFLL